MKKILFLAATILVLASCSKSTSFKITGEASDSLKFAYYSHDYFNSDKVDSVAVSDGKFVIEGDVDTVTFAFVALEDGRSWNIVLEPGEITLCNDGGTATGTPLNDAFTEFVKKMNVLEDETSIKESFAELVKAHPDDILGAYIVETAKQLISPTFAQELAKTLSATGKEYLWKFEPQEQFEAPEKGKVGDMFTDFEVEYEGKIQKLSDYVGKGQYTLVDFWASWCGPCKAEIPYIKQLYEDYGDKGLTVLGVATWDEPENTKAAIEELGITYPQIMNAQKIGSDAYGIEGIPMIILFGPDGTILNKDLRGEQMVKTVEEVMK